MKVDVLTLKNEKKSSIDLPAQFSEIVREDIIKKAVLALQSSSRQPYGAYPRAGQDVSAELSRRRRNYRGSYGMGISRVPRKIMSRRGTRMNWVGALAPGTVGGRRAHPPKPEKNWDKKVNKKENRLAIRSGLSASVLPEVVSARGHAVPKNYPFVVESAFEDLKKTSEAIKILESFGFKEELARTNDPIARTGRARTRGRRNKIKAGLLVVTGKENSTVSKAVSNIPGVECVSIESINAELLAPGAHPGRLALYTEDAIKKLQDEQLFVLTKIETTKKTTKKVTA